MENFVNHFNESEVNKFIKNSSTKVCPIKDRNSYGCQMFIDGLQFTTDYTKPRIMDTKDSISSLVDKVSILDSRNIILSFQISDLKKRLYKFEKSIFYKLYRLFNK